MVFFGYPFCPDACPPTLTTVSETVARLGAAASQVQPLFITVDPQRGAVERVTEYVTAFDAGIIGLTGYARADEANDPDYLMKHSALHFILDPNCRFSAIVSTGGDVGPSWRNCNGFSMANWRTATAVAARIGLFLLAVLAGAMAMVPPAQADALGVEVTAIVAGIGATASPQWQAMESTHPGMPTADPQHTYIMVLALSVGLAAAVALLAATAWSIAVPSCRLWPPERSSVVNRFIVWLLTIAIFASAIVLGLLDWNGMGLSAPLRWATGLPLILAGNAIVWYGVAQIGMRATSGDVVELKRDGLYRYSRNPQYIADMGILIGWLILSGSSWALPIVSAGVVPLAMVPLAEERWLLDRYGADYAAYRRSTPRFIGFGSAPSRQADEAGSSDLSSTEQSR